MNDAEGQGWMQNQPDDGTGFHALRLTELRSGAWAMRPDVVPHDIYVVCGAEKTRFVVFTF